jgi:hypothetical protein
MKAVWAIPFVFCMVILSGCTAKDAEDKEINGIQFGIFETVLDEADCQAEIENGTQYDCMIVSVNLQERMFDCVCHI